MMVYHYLKIQVGEKNLNWTKFKENYLLIFNSAVVISIITFSLQFDLLVQLFIWAWFILCLFNFKLRNSSKKIITTLEKINSAIILTLFYFLFFTPFAFIYKGFFKNRAFIKSHSRYVKKDSISDFQYPF